MGKKKDNDYPILNSYYEAFENEYVKEILEFNRDGETAQYRTLTGIADLLNEKQYRIEDLKTDNDIKFWKLQYMHLFNTNSLFVSEIERAIQQGYEISDKMKEYLKELKQERMEVMAKAKEEDEW